MKKYKIVKIKWRDASRTDNRPLDFGAQLLSPIDYGLLYEEYKDESGIEFVRLVQTYEPIFHNNNFTDIPKGCIVEIKEIGEDELG